MVVRVAGVILPENKHILIALQEIYGVGKHRAMSICRGVGVPFCLRTSEVSHDFLNKIQEFVLSYEVEGDLRRKIVRNIKRLCDIKCYRGMRHRLSLPVRGQRTRTNASTRKKLRKH